MVLDYSKWDKLELSDDSDVEVHPNVDKKSFIKWKQRDIHEKRERNRLRTQQLELNIETNGDLLRRIDRLISASESGTPIGRDVDSSVALSAGDETKEKPSLATGPEQPKYNDMIESMLVQVTQETSSEPQIVEKLKEHRGMIESALFDENKELEQLHEERAKYIGSEDIKDGWNSTLLNKSDGTTKQSGSTGPAPGTGTDSVSSSTKAPASTDSSSSTVASNASAAAPSTSGSSPGAASGSATTSGSAKPKKNSDGLEELLPATREFGQVPKGDLSAAARYLQQHPEIVNEGQKDALMMSAFDAELSGDTTATARIVYNALLLQYSALLGKTGASTFFSRIMQPNHPAREAFETEAKSTYEHIRGRSAILKEESEKEQEGVEQIQLHSVDPETEIAIKLPEEGSEGWAIYDKFPQGVKDAIKTESLEEINKVLGEMSVEDAEKLVNELSESGVLLVEDKIYDATEFQKKAAAEAHSSKGEAAEEQEQEPTSTIEELD